jgi:hypothetical protein
MTGSEMKTLQLRKQALLLESDLNRLRLRAELGQLREAADLTSNLKRLAERIGPWAMTLAPLAGIVAALGLRRREAGGGFLRKAFNVAPALIRLWRAFAKPSKESEPEAGP